MLYSLKIFKLEIILDAITNFVNLLSQYMTPSMIGLRYSKARTQKLLTAEAECIVEKDAVTEVDDQIGEDSTNNGNNGKPCFAKNTKCTMTGDNEDKGDRHRNNGYDGCRHNIPIVTNYYCYDQRVYNIYRVRDEEESGRSHGLGINASLIGEALNLLKAVNWRYVLIATSLMIVGITLVFCLGVDMLSWLIFHKVFGYLFNNNLVVAKDKDEVPLCTV